MRTASHGKSFVEFLFWYQLSTLIGTSNENGSTSRPESKRLMNSLADSGVLTQRCLVQSSQPPTVVLGIPRHRFTANATAHHSPEHFLPCAISASVTSIFTIFMLSAFIVLACESQRTYCRDRLAVRGLGTAIPLVREIAGETRPYIGSGLSIVIHPCGTMQPRRDAHESGE